MTEAALRRILLQLTHELMLQPAITSEQAQALLLAALRQACALGADGKRQATLLQERALTGEAG